MFFSTAKQEELIGLEAEEGLKEESQLTY